MKVDLKNIGPKQVIAVILVIVMILDFAALAARKIDTTTFWIIAGAIAAITYMFYKKKIN